MIPESDRSKVKSLLRIPADIQDLVMDAVAMWTWLKKEGLREKYLNDEEFQDSFKESLEEIHDELIQEEESQKGGDFN